MSKEPAITLDWIRRKAGDIKAAKEYEYNPEEIE